MLYSETSFPGGAFNDGAGNMTLNSNGGELPPYALSPEGNKLGHSARTLGGEKISVATSLFERPMSPLPRQSLD